MVALKILMLKKFKNHPKGQWLNLYHRLIIITSTVDPSCEVIAKILQWLSGHVVFAKILGYVAI